MEKERLDEYVESRKFTITPIYERKEVKPLKGITSKEIATSPNEREELEGVILTEILSQELKLGVIGISFHDEPNPNFISSNGRLQYLHNNVRHYSPKWPEWLHMEAYNQINWRIQQQWRWYSGWGTIWGSATWYNGDYDDFNIDGPWYVRFEIDYDYDTDFGYYWINN